MSFAQPPDGGSNQPPEGGSNQPPDGGSRPKKRLTCDARTVETKKTPVQMEEKTKVISNNQSSLISSNGVVQLRARGRGRRVPPNTKVTFSQSPPGDAVNDASQVLDNVQAKSVNQTGNSQQRQLLSATSNAEAAGPVPSVNLTSPIHGGDEVSAVPSSMHDLLGISLQDSLADEPSCAPPRSKRPSFCLLSPEELDFTNNFPLASAMPRAPPRFVLPTKAELEKAYLDAKKLSTAIKSAVAAAASPPKLVHVPRPSPASITKADGTPVKSSLKPTPNSSGSSSHNGASSRGQRQLSEVRRVSMLQFQMVKSDSTCKGRVILQPSRILDVAPTVRSPGSSTMLRPVSVIGSEELPVGDRRPEGMTLIQYSRSIVQLTIKKMNEKVNGVRVRGLWILPFWMQLRSGGLPEFVSELIIFAPGCGLDVKKTYMTFVGIDFVRYREVNLEENTTLGEQDPRNKDGYQWDRLIKAIATKLAYVSAKVATWVALVDAGVLIHVMFEAAMEATLASTDHVDPPCVYNPSSLPIPSLEEFEQHPALAQQWQEALWASLSNEQSTLCSAQMQLVNEIYKELFEPSSPRLGYACTFLRTTDPMVTAKRFLLVAWLFAAYNKGVPQPVQEEIDVDNEDVADVATGSSMGRPSTSFSSICEVVFAESSALMCADIKAAEDAATDETPYTTPLEARERRHAVATAILRKQQSVAATQRGETTKELREKMRALQEELEQREFDEATRLSMAEPEVFGLPTKVIPMPPVTGVEGKHRREENSANEECPPPPSSGASSGPAHPQTQMLEEEHESDQEEM